MVFGEHGLVGRRHNYHKIETNKDFYRIDNLDRSNVVVFDTYHNMSYKLPIENHKHKSMLEHCREDTAFGVLLLLSLLLSLLLLLLLTSLGGGCWHHHDRMGYLAML